MKLIKALTLVFLVFGTISTLNGQQSSSIKLADEYEGKISLLSPGTIRTLYIFEKPSKAIVRKIVDIPGQNTNQMLFNSVTERMELTPVFLPPSSKTDDFIGTYTRQGNKIRITVADLTVEATIVNDGLEGILTWKDGSKEAWAAIKISEKVSNISEANSAASNNKYSAPVDSPVIGTWKYQDDCRTSTLFGNTSTYCSRTSTFTYSQDGNVHTFHIINLSTYTADGNWKYTAENQSSGVLEEFKDGRLIEKGNVKFLGKSQLQYTITFSANSDIVGKTYIWSKQ